MSQKPRRPKDFYISILDDPVRLTIYCRNSKGHNFLNRRLKKGVSWPEYDAAVKKSGSVLGLINAIRASGFTLEGRTPLPPMREVRTT